MLSIIHSNDIITQVYRKYVLKFFCIGADIYANSCMLGTSVNYWVCQIRVSFRNAKEMYGPFFSMIAYALEATPLKTLMTVTYPSNSLDMF